MYNSSPSYYIQSISEFHRCGLSHIWFSSLLFFLCVLQTGAVQEHFYKDCDLTVGGEVNVWGRKVIIADCDDFTKDYYRTKYGIGNQYYDVIDFWKISIATNVF